MYNVCFLELSPNLLNVSRDEKEGAPQRKDDVSFFYFFNSAILTTKMISFSCMKDKWLLEDAARGDFGRLLTISVKSVAGSIGKEVGDQALLLAVKQNNVKAARLLIESGTY